MTCGGLLPACTNDDVVRGLSQLSAQLQGLGAYVMVVAGLLMFWLVALVVLTFANHR